MDSDPIDCDDELVNEFVFVAKVKAVAALRSATALQTSRGFRGLFRLEVFGLEGSLVTRAWRYQGVASGFNVF
jgi:hypothetical protein